MIRLSQAIFVYYRVNIDWVFGIPRDSGKETIMDTSTINWMAWVACLAWGLIFSAATSAEEAAAWKAGVARCDITPREPMWLAGYGGRDHVAEGTLHPIGAKALAIEDAAGRRALLVTSDLLGFPKGMSGRIRDRLSATLGLSRAEILLNSSHTHTGPVLEDSLYNIYPLDETEIAKIEKYSRALENQIVKMAAEAFKKLAPARLAAANGVTRFAVNRRNNSEAAILETHEFKGPVDHAVPVLKVEREDGALLAVVFGYACHATTLSFYQWSGDYPGFAQLDIETAHPGATAMFFAGCGGDQNPLPRRTVSLAQQYGAELAAAVERVLTEPMKPLASELKTVYNEIELVLTAPPARGAIEKLAQDGSVYQKRAAARFLRDLDAGKPLPAAYPYPIQLWRLGEQTLVAMGGEVVVDYAIFLKKMLGNNLFVMGYSNDVMAYIPSVRVLNEGGYEGESAMMLYGLPSKWQPDVESRILTAVKTLAQQVGLTPAVK